MRYFIITGLGLIFLIFACQKAGENRAMSNEELVKKGAYLVTLGGCNDCHSPKKMTPQGPVPDENLLLSGHPQNLKLPPVDPSKIGPGQWVLIHENMTAFVGPWGMSFAANLTPDEQTGIGLWSPEHFINAMRTGKHMGAGRPILPPMPWFNLRQVNDDDLRAIFAYFKSLTPIKNQVPAPVAPPDLGKI